MRRFIFLFFLLCTATLLSAQYLYQNQDVNTFRQSVTQEAVQVVDVRTQAEYDAGHIAGALLIDFKASDFMEQVLRVVDKNRPVALYCRSGRRSEAAAKLLSEHGYRAINLLGGMLEWEKTQPVAH